MMMIRKAVPSVLFRLDINNYCGSPCFLDLTIAIGFCTCTLRATLQMVLVGVNVVSLEINHF